MKTPKAFHGDEKIKQKYLDRVKQHRQADALIKGTGRGMGSMDGRGGGSKDPLALVPRPAFGTFEGGEMKPADVPCGTAPLACVRYARRSNSGQRASL